MLVNWYPDNVSLRDAVSGLPGHDGSCVDSYMSKDVVISHNELRKPQFLVFMPVDVDVPTKGFNLLLGFNVHFKGLLRVFDGLVGAGGELPVSAFRKNEVNVGLHNLSPFFLNNIQKLCQTFTIYRENIV